MATGRDIAKFVTKVTGKNYLGLYDESEAEEERMMEQKKRLSKDFSMMMERFDNVDKNNSKDVID